MSDQETEVKTNAVRRVHALSTEFETNHWRSHFKDIATYMLTRRGRYLDSSDYDPNLGSKQNSVINNGVAEEAIHTASAGMMHGFTSPSQPWALLMPADPGMATFKPVMDYLWAMQQVMYSVFARSNLYDRLPMVYQELDAFGNVAFRVDENLSRTIHCTQHTIGSFYFGNGVDGSVDTVPHRFPRTVRQLVKQYGIDKVSRTTKERFERKELDVWVKCVNVLESNEDQRDIRFADWRGMPWRSTTYEEDSDEDEVLKIGGFRVFPTLTPRTSVIDGDAYGSSKGMRALPDTKELQILEKKKKEGLAKQITPAMTQPASTKTLFRASSQPNAVNYSRDGDARSIGPTHVPDIPYGSILNEQATFETRINRILGADIFSLFEDFDRAGGREMTAFETAERRAEKTARFGPMQQAVFNDLLRPLVELSWFYMGQNGQLAPPPPEVSELPIRVVFMSQQALAQRSPQTHDTEQYMRVVAEFESLGYVGITDNVDSDTAAREIQTGYLTAPSILMEPGAVDEIRAARAQAAQAAQAAEEGIAGAQLAKDLGNAQMGEETALETLTG